MSLETARFSSPGRCVPTPPNKKLLISWLGPGSRGVVSEMAPNWLLDHPLEATTGSKSFEMLPSWFLHLLGSQLDPTWAPPEEPRRGSRGPAGRARKFGGSSRGPAGRAGKFGGGGGPDAVGRNPENGPFPETSSKTAPVQTVPYTPRRHTSHVWGSWQGVRK